jgi:hypothetical protein
MWEILPSSAHSEIFCNKTLADYNCISTAFILYFFYFSKQLRYLLQYHAIIHYLQGPTNSINISIVYYPEIYLQEILLATYGSRTIINISGEKYIKRTFIYYNKTLDRM